MHLKETKQSTDEYTCHSVRICRSNVVLELFAQIINESCYDQLRTKVGGLAGFLVPWNFSRFF